MRRLRDWWEQDFGQTRVLVGKLVRDVRLPLVVVALLLGAFQCLWAKVTERILGKLSPLFNSLAALAGMTPKDIQDALFEGPGKIMRTIIGGERLVLDNAMDMLSIGYVHPLMQTIFCIWAIGRAAGAIAGELDRGTMELLLAQPLPRSRLVLAHLLVDLLTIPVLCLALWAGNFLGAWLITPIKVEQPTFQRPLPRPAVLIDLGPITVRLEQPADRRPRQPSEESQRRLEEQLRVEPVRFGKALVLVGGLIFAVSGYTMWLSAVGRFRWRVLSLAVFLTLLQFLVNVLGQMWDALEALRPFTIFYYYQPQQVILGGDWDVTLREWNGGKSLLTLPMPLVLYGVGLVGYGMALWVFQRRDLPAPL
jgi:ABC-2 type transport system permease protein